VPHGLPGHIDPIFTIEPPRLPATSFGNALRDEEEGPCWFQIAVIVGSV